MAPASTEALNIPDRSLAVFVDDTGHEALVPGHPVYGIGGCAVLGRDLVRLIWNPWKEIRKRVGGSPDTPLHASDFSKIASQTDIEAVAEFFRVNPFARFGAIITKDTILADDLSLMETMREVLEVWINEILQWILCRDVHIIFESSERVDKLIERTFQNFNLLRGPKPIPSECYFMPKSSAEPAREVADFVMHAVGRQARRNLTKQGVFEFVPDFKAVFHQVDRKLSTYIQVASVTKSPNQSAGRG
jgi:hypothetical protein